MQYAFTPESQLPAEVGFLHFGPGHLTVLLVLAVISGAVVLLGCRMREPRRLKLERAMAVAMVGMELVKDFILGLIGAFDVGYLPLHLCSIAMFICLYWAWHPHSDGAGQLLWSLCFSGGLAALLFPDWTDMPLVHFQSVHSFVYHAMLVQFSLLAVISGQARPSLKSAWKAGVFLVVVAVPVYGFDRAFGTNYMFLLRPVPGTPLELCARLPGQWGYLLGYGLLVAAVLVVLNLPFSLARRRHRSV